MNTREYINSLFFNFPIMSMNMNFRPSRQCTTKTDTDCNDAIACFQGDLTQQEKRAVFMTVHDLGCNRKYCSNLHKCYYVIIICPITFALPSVVCGVAYFSFPMISAIYAGNGECIPLGQSNNYKLKLMLIGSH